MSIPSKYLPLSHSARIILMSI